MYSGITEIFFKDMQNTKFHPYLICAVCIAILVFSTIDSFAQEILNTKDSIQLSVQLSEAILKNDTSVVDSLIEIGVDVNNTTAFGVTPLMYASEEGNLYVMKKLIFAGANVNAVPDNKITALLSATISDKKEAVLLLLQNGVNIESADDEGNTALLIAAQNNSLETVKLLLDFKANIQAKNSDKNNALHFAAAFGNDSLVVLLINSGIYLNEKDKLGFTPIMVAVASNRIETAELLLSYGADLNLVNNENLSVLSLAILNGNAYLTELFLINGVVTNHLSGNARDHWYFAQGTDKSIKKLLQKFDVKKNRKPVLESFLLGTELGISKNILKPNVIFGVKESKYNFQLQLAFGVTPFVYSSLDLIDGKTYQFWRRDYFVSFELDKYFSFKQNFTTEYGIYFGIEPGILFGTYRGTKINPSQKYTLSPGGGLFFRRNFVESRLGYEYEILNNSKVSTFGFQVVCYLNKI